ncbi:MAG: helix-turn-helix domain-containing protein [Acetobacteraceae bacterium]
MVATLQEIVARNIRAERRRLGLSQEALAARCGLHRTYVGGIERAERNITLTTLERIAAAVGVPVAALIVPRGSG